MPRRLVLVVAALVAAFTAARPTHAQRAAAAVTFRRAPIAHADVAGPQHVAMPPGRHACSTVCTTGAGALIGAGVGALAGVVYVHNKPASRRSIADGPGIALSAILGGVVGGATGFTYGLVRH